MLANKRPDLALKHADSFEYYLEDKWFLELVCIYFC
jgi:hypothetical protein